MQIAVINHNTKKLYVTIIPIDLIIDESGDICEDKLLNEFNELYDVNLRPSECSWGEIETFISKTF